MSETNCHLSPGCCRRFHRWVELVQIPGHPAHEPFEAFAVQPALQLLLGHHVSCRQVAVLRPALVDICSVFVHPHLRNRLQILNAKQKLTKSPDLPAGIAQSAYYPPMNKHRFGLQQQQSDINSFQSLQNQSADLHECVFSWSLKCVNVCLPLQDQVTSESLAFQCRAAGQNKNQKKSRHFQLHSELQAAAEAYKTNVGQLRLR